jgi:hypothetical protein
MASKATPDRPAKNETSEFPSMRTSPLYVPERLRSILLNVSRFQESRLRPLTTPLLGVEQDTAKQARFTIVDCC